MSDLTREQVEAWAKLAEQATPGPWWEEKDAEASGVWWIQAKDEEEDGESLAIGTTNGDQYDEEADACFIASARTAVPALAAAWLEQREKIEEVRKNAKELIETRISDVVAVVMQEKGTICYHCGHHVKAGNVDHWQTCELHPAREILAEKDAEIERLRDDVTGLREEIAARKEYRAADRSQLAALRKVAEGAKPLATRIHTMLLDGPDCDCPDKDHDCGWPDLEREWREVDDALAALAEKEKPDAQR